MVNDQVQPRQKYALKTNQKISEWIEANQPGGGEPGEKQLSIAGKNINQIILPIAMGGIVDANQNKCQEHIDVKITAVSTI